MTKTGWVTTSRVRGLARPVEVSVQASIRRVVVAAATRTVTAFFLTDTVSSSPVPLASCLMVPSWPPLTVIVDV